MKRSPHPVTTNVYDTINRLTSTTDAASITVSFGYDLVDNRTSVTDGLSHTTHFGYDGLKRNTTTTDPAGKTTTLAYDAINKISRMDSKRHSRTRASVPTRE